MLIPPHFFAKYSVKLYSGVPLNCELPRHGNYAFDFLNYQLN